MEPSHGSPASDAGEELLRHARWLRQLARSLVADPERADDLVQDAWLAALRRPPSERALRPWLRTVVRHAAWQGWRRREPLDASSELGGADALPGEPAPDEIAERLETERRLTDELARLEDPFRKVLVLRYYDGLEPTEIARRLGVPAGTIRWRAKRGLELLRERLDRRFGGRGAWCALFLPLASGREPIAAGLTTGAAAVQGVLAMNVLTKLGAGAAGIAALALTLGVAGVLPRAVWPLRGEASAPLTVRPYAAAEEPAPERADAPQRAVLDGSAAGLLERAPADTDALSSNAPPTLVEARAVDANGVPVAGAFLRELAASRSRPAALLEVQGGERAARSGSDGRLELALDLEGADGPLTMRFELGGSGLASVAHEAVVHPHERVSLGTHVLRPAGAVSGRVVDPDGRPLAGVDIAHGEADLPRRVLEAQRLRVETALVPTTLTGADGHFTLDRLQTGRVRLWASAKGSLASYSPPVEVRAGEEAYGLELVLEPLPPENRVSLAVVDPGGAPVAGALLEFRHASRSNGTTVAGQVSADAEGRHEFVVQQDATLSVTARDPSQRHGPASATDLRPGARVHVLRLSAARTFELLVRDPSGAPIERYGFSLLAPSGDFEHQRAPRAERPGGAAEARLPGGDFRLQVDAPQHELAEFGPFSAAGIDGRIEVVLTPVPGVRGRVLAGGRPVAGARVRLHPLVEAGVRFEKDGFVSLWSNETTDEVETDGTGRFVLTVRRAGEYAARAEKTGFAPAVSETLRIGAGLQAPELVLELTEGGAIEGRVIAAPGGEPAGTIVGLSRGDGYDRTLRVGPDGAYRFERLTPGPWRLVAAAEEIAPGRTHMTTGDARGPIVLEWTCTVRARETSTCDLVLEDQRACVLRGRLLFDGAAPGPWQAWLVPEGQLFDAQPAGLAALDSEGRFLLSAAGSRRHQLAIASALEGPGMQWVLDVVALREGEVRWEEALETGWLVVAGVPEWDGEGVPGAVYLWKGRGELSVLTVLATPEGGELRVRVPSGPGRLVRPVREERDLARWPTLLELDVPRGGELRTELP